MIAIVQRVLSAEVTVAGRSVGKIGKGLCVLAAVHADDTEADIAWLAPKLVGLRTFPQGDKNFDLDVRAAGGAILLISNFTVAADTRKGRRPSLDPAAGPDLARQWFEKLLAAVRREAAPAAVATGEFGADMRVDLANDGPVTWILDSRASRD